MSTFLVRLWLFVVPGLFSAVAMPASGMASEARVFASNYPLAYFAERISGQPSLVHFPRIDGDPAFWRPEAADVIAMQRSEVILLNGAGYEKWLTTVSLPLSRTFDTSARFGANLITRQDAVTHAHGAQQHSHGATAFTTWIDLTQAVAQAEAVHDALATIKLVPDATLRANLDALRADLKAFDDALAEVSERLGETPLIGSHPVYQYLARRYGLDIKSVHWEPDVRPTEEMMAELRSLRSGHPARWMVWEARPLDETVEQLAALGIGSVVFDPSGNRPEEGDFLSVMEANVGALGSITGSPSN